MDEELERAAHEAFLKRLARPLTKDLEITVEGEPSPCRAALPGSGHLGLGRPLVPRVTSSPGSPREGARFGRQPVPTRPARSRHRKGRPWSRHSLRPCQRACRRPRQGAGADDTELPRPSTRCTLGGLSHQPTQASPRHHGGRAGRAAST
jgi:hypothetical protein